MANLKGSSFEKQIRDARIRLDMRGIKQENYKGQHLSHGTATHFNRISKMNDFAKYLREQGIDNGKLNEHINDQNLQNFLKERTQNLKETSAETYIRDFNGLIKGLKSVNISIPSHHDKIINNLVKPLKKIQKDTPIQKDRYISKKEFQQNIQKLPSHMQPIARLQYQHGFRVEEALKIARSPEKYIKNSKIVGVQGKGGRVYKPKRISPQLKKDLQKAIKISKSTYQKSINRAFQTFNHNFRLSYSINKVEELKREGMSQIAAQRATSEEMNHSREETTRYYQIRA